MSENYVEKQINRDADSSKVEGNDFNSNNQNSFEALEREFKESLEFDNGKENLLGELSSSQINQSDLQNIRESERTSTKLGFKGGLAMGPGLKLSAEMRMDNNTGAVSLDLKVGFSVGLEWGVSSEYDPNSPGGVTNNVSLTASQQVEIYGVTPVGGAKNTITEKGIHTSFMTGLGYGATYSIDFTLSQRLQAEKTLKR